MTTNQRRIQILLQHLQQPTITNTNNQPIQHQQCSSNTYNEDEVLYQVQDGVAIITLNRPKRGNAYTPKMQELYFDAIDRANDDVNVVAIVVTGSGNVFCVGADKDDLSDIQTGTTTTTSSTIKKKLTNRDTAQVQALEKDKPIVAAINGPVAGLGLVTALMCDVRFACKGVKFTTAFAKRGLVAEHGIAYVLPKIVGLSRALDLLMSSRVILTDEALSMGLINFVSSTPQQCLQDAIKYARDTGKLCSPAALAEIKKQIYTKPLSPREDYDRAIDLMLRSFNHPDFKEGVGSLIEKRDPKFQGLNGGRISSLGKVGG
jgi:enoyl-CoA hydratase/carnithine racemase